MDELNEFYKKIQMYLMKKNQECGELKLLNLCITDDNSSHIADVRNTITGIFETYNIPIKDKASVNNEKCVHAYKYLLLNTHFNNQERLAEDISSGHLVDMCPPLSPYLFIQILWNIEYEKILIESFLHVPLDLCTELLDIITRHVDELPFERSVETIYHLIDIVYAKVLQLRHFGIQSSNVEESIQKLSNGFEHFLSVLMTSKGPYLTEVSKLQAYERQGIMFKKLVCTTRKCLELLNKGIVIPQDMEKLYNIKFGGEPFTMCESTYVNSILTSMNREILNSLLDKTKLIDCNIYLNWAEIGDMENKTISLQRSIGIECYCLIKLVTNDEELSQNTHLIECLQQLASQPDTKQSSFILSLQELCCAINNGKTKLLKELLSRYKEWDCSIIQFVYDNRTLLKKKDCLILLEYLMFIFAQSTDEHLKEFSNTCVTKILLFQSVSDMYEIIMMYVMKHNGKNNLQLPHTEKAFHEFIMRNRGLQLCMNLKTVLVFLLRSPRMILTTMLKIFIGHSDYGNIMISAHDLLLLSSFLKIREDDSRILLSSILRDICIEDRDWNANKFIYSIQLFRENSMIETRELINNVFIPYLNKDTLNVSNIHSVITSIRQSGLLHRTNSFNGTNVKDLIMALLRTTSFIRRHAGISKFRSSELVHMIGNILLYCLTMESFPTSTRKEILDDIVMVHLTEPIDKLVFSCLERLMNRRFRIIDIIEDYERRYFAVLNRLKEDPKTPGKLRDYLSDLSLLREDLLRYLIICSTENEFKILYNELMTYSFSFGWNMPTDVCHTFSRLTIEACCLCLEYPSIGGNDLFPFLFKCYTRFCEHHMTFFYMPSGARKAPWSYYYTNQLKNSIKHSSYADLYTTFITRLQDSEQNNFKEDIGAIFRDFSDQCLLVRNECVPCKLPHSPKVSNFYKIHEVISAFMEVPASGAYECVRRMSQLFLSS